MNLSDYNVLKKCLTTIKNASKDSSNNVCMSESSKIVVNFDQIKGKCFYRFNGNALNSVDALAQGPNGKIYFIEFKNGQLSDKTATQLDRKAFDSIALLCFVSGKDFKKVKDDIIFVLVYNSSKQQRAEMLAKRANIVNDRLSVFKQNYSELYSKVIVLDKSKFNEILKRDDKSQNVCMKRHDDPFDILSLYD
ncbi:MAG: hypothetical protein VZR11_02710 [Succinimonas sp.]|nr:hypothetical protein [Succinimonas sp.]